MYRALRTARIKAGKEAEALRWAAAFPKLVNEKYPGHNAEVYIQAFGALDILYWTATYTDLADLESWEKAIGDDPAYLALVAKTADYIVEGTQQLTLVRKI
jgi:antibiotic biosynthesis monooxygenase (ABM) superfamily enzyme